MRVLLVSTYELGHQPVHLASPAARLVAGGAEVRCVDLSVTPFDDSMLDGADAVAFSVPMHTATRLATTVAAHIREVRPEMPIAFYGLYAGVGSEWTLGNLADALIAGEYEEGLQDWVLRLGDGTSGPAITTSVGKTSFGVPARGGLPSSEAYARLEWQGEARLAAAVEASHGCRHRCRHCPIPVLYDGRLRVVGAETVLSDIDQLAGAGVLHVTFSDPDFLNAPAYSMGILREAHGAHPQLTFDVTVKVEHVLKYRELWPEMADLGVLFVVSAFESVDQQTLGILDKGHTVADMTRAISVLRGSGIHPRPTWLPFFPWTQPADLVDLARFIDHHRLWSSTDPVQLTIKLLIPEGSLLEGHPSVVPHLAAYDPEAMTWRWEFASQATRTLQRELDEIAATASDCGLEAAATLEEMRATIGRVSGFELGPMPRFDLPAPRLSESWFCCAEPTSGQAVAVGVRIGSVAGTLR